jgi:hypothetical protein
MRHVTSILTKLKARAAHRPAAMHHSLKLTSIATQDDVHAEYSHVPIDHEGRQPACTCDFAQSPSLNKATSTS